MGVSLFVRSFDKLFLHQIRLIRPQLCCGSASDLGPQTSQWPPPPLGGHPTPTLHFSTPTLFTVQINRETNFWVHYWNPTRRITAAQELRKEEHHLCMAGDNFRVSLLHVTSCCDNTKLATCNLPVSTPKLRVVGNCHCDFGIPSILSGHGL